MHEYVSWRTTPASGCLYPFLAATAIPRATSISPTHSTSSSVTIARTAPSIPSPNPHPIRHSAVVLPHLQVETGYRPTCRRSGRCKERRSSTRSLRIAHCLSFLALSCMIVILRRLRNERTQSCGVLFVERATQCSTAQATDRHLCDSGCVLRRNDGGMSQRSSRMVRLIVDGDGEFRWS
jgi:hypothetical protein